MDHTVTIADERIGTKIANFMRLKPNTQTQRTMQTLLQSIWHQEESRFKVREWQNGDCESIVSDAINAFAEGKDNEAFKHIQRLPAIQGTQGDTLQSLKQLAMLDGARAESLQALEGATATDPDASDVKAQFINHIIAQLLSVLEDTKRALNDVKATALLSTTRLLQQLRNGGDALPRIQTLKPLREEDRSMPVVAARFPQLVINLLHEQPSGQQYQSMINELPSSANVASTASASSAALREPRFSWTGFFARNNVPARFAALSESLQRWSELVAPQENSKEFDL
jgi:hypothetical protein